MTKMRMAMSSTSRKTIWIRPPATGPMKMRITAADMAATCALITADREGRVCLERTVCQEWPGRKFGPALSLRALVSIILA